MRRALSIFFVLLFGFGPLTATIDAAAEAQLPACCRRHGAHHCEMSSEIMAQIARISTRVPSFTAPAHCPLYPGPAHALLPPMHALATAQDGTYQLATTTHLIAAPVARALAGPSRNAASRAPPSFLI